MLAAPKTKKEALTVTDMRRLVDQCGGHGATLMDIRTVCICLLSFAAFLRFDELANLRCSDVRVREDHVELRIRSSKTDQYRDGDLVPIARSGGKACTVAMLERYISLGGIQLDSEQYLFRAVLKTKRGETLRGGGSKMTYTRVRELVLQKLAALGLEVSRYGLHSLRAGGATAAANAGVPDRLFKRHGRWKSETAKDGYVKDSMATRLEVSKSLGL